MSIEPNENGVYPKDAAEQISWPGSTPRIYAHIYALFVDGVWLGAKSYQMGGSDMRGGTGPLMKNMRYLAQKDHTDRQSCVAEEARDIIRSITTSDCKMAPLIREWCAGLIDGPIQPDLFGAAA